ncbi:MFS transporter [Halobacillus rhizosphaerae]|uniref:MFS transporter n=1 Tax=Halobacillus rhizosphaerae TaxID=3064889 RepID=UPI00398A6D3B
MKKLVHTVNRELKVLPSIVWALLGACFIESTARFMAMPFIALYFTQVAGLTVTQTGLLLGIPPLSSLLFSVAGGRLADRFGVGKLFLLSLSVPALCLIGFATLGNYIILCMISAIAGLGWALFNSTNQSLISAYTSEVHYSKVFSYRYWFFNLGGTIGPLLGAYMGSGQSPLPILLFSGVLLALTLILGSMFYRGKKVNSSSHQSKYNAKKADMFGRILKVIVQDKVFIPLVFSCFFMFAIESQRDVTVVQYLADDFANGVDLFARLIALTTLLIVIFQPIAGKILDRMSYSQAFLNGSILYSLGPLLFVFSSSPWHWYVSITIFTFGEILVAPKRQALIAKIAKKEMRTTYFSVSNMGGYAAFFIGPWAGSYVLQQFNGPVLFSIMFGAGIMAGCSLVIAARNFRYAGEVFRISKHGS